MTIVKALEQDEFDALIKNARLTKFELAERLGHWNCIVARWGINLPTYAVEYLLLRESAYDVIEHLEYGTVPEDFDFLVGLKAVGLKKTELGKLLGVNKYTVSRWQNSPPTYALEYVYCRYLLVRYGNGRKTK